MNERVVPKMTNFCVAYMDVAVRRSGILNHNPIHPELIRGSLIGHNLTLGRWISLSVGARVFIIASGFALAVDKYIIKRLAQELFRQGRARSSR